VNRATYYSPLWLGALLILALNESIRARYAFAEPWVQWAGVGFIAVVFGLECQFLMIGAQGAFAQVLPVPRGRSIRGRAAAVAGWLAIGVFVLGDGAAVMKVNGMGSAALVPGLAALVALIAGVVIYVWNLPAAVADFGDDRGV
jgi:predicted membrane channel-forming protein YqfA (hemolysin III family)